MAKKNYNQLSSLKLYALLMHANECGDKETAVRIRSILNARIDGCEQGQEEHAEKFVILKKTGQFGTTMIREFDDETSAKSFVKLMRESEEHDFIEYTIAKVMNY